MPEAAPREGRGLVRLIAVFKLVKVLALITVGLGSLDVLGKGTNQTVAHWLAATGINSSGPLAERILFKIDLLDTRKLEEISAASFFYALLFSIEGLGLWFDRPWAEYFTVIITGSFIPFELYELAKHPSVLKGLAFAINVAVLVYLVVRIARRRRSRASSGMRRPPVRVSA